MINMKQGYGKILEIFDHNVTGDVSGKDLV